MTRTRVGVLRGGPSSEYDVSLKSGAAVLSALSEEQFEIHDILIDREGTWHHLGTPKDIATLTEYIDVFFNALHGEYGENGRLQQLLDMHGARYTGAGALASALGMHKAHAKALFREADIRVPQHVVIEYRGAADAEAHELFRSFPGPWVVKPVARGSSVGIGIARTHRELAHALAEAGKHSEMLLVETFIPGREATVGVVEDMRGEKLYTLPPVEIIPPEGRFFDSEVKYDGSTQEICPGNFSADIKQALMHAARLAHQALGARHYSRSDFIVSPSGIFLLETNTLPGLTEESLLPKALDAVGISLGDFTGHLVGLAKRDE